MRLIYVGIAGRLMIAGVMLVLASPVRASSVIEQNGDVVLVEDGGRRVLARGDNHDPVLSPDGSLVAYVHRDRAASGDGESALTSLRVFDVRNGDNRILTEPSNSLEPKANFTFFERPIFSLDGGFIYVSANAWATSQAVQQVKVATGERRFIIDGSALAVVRNGPFRGYLLVQRHVYRDSGGADDPVYVVRPDAGMIFAVPGSADDSRGAVQTWLRENHWDAW